MLPTLRFPSASGTSGERTPEKVGEGEPGEPQQPLSEPPDGGREAWMTLGGAWLVQFCTYGYISAFGVYQDFYTRDFLSNYTASDISWIGSFQLAMQYFPAVFVGRAFDAGCFHYTSIAGTVLYIFSIMMLSLAQRGHYYQVFLSQGVGMGLAQGILFLPSLTIISHHFKRRRALATGIAGTGASAGGIVFPILLNRLFAGRVGFADGVRASGGIVGALLVLANLLMRTWVPPKAARGCSRREFVGAVVDAPYLASLAGAFFTTLGLFFPPFYMQLWSIEHGINTQLAFYTVAILNAGSVAGRLLPTFLADHLGVYNMIVPAIFASSVLLWAVFAAKSSATVIVISVLFGFSSGAYTSLIPALLATLARNVAELGLRMGFAFSVVGIAMLVGTPIDGALLGENFTWWRPIVFSAVCVLAGSVFMTVSRTMFVRARGGKQMV